MEPHMLVETYGRVVAVYVQLYRERARVDRFQVSYSLFDDETPDSRTMQGRQRIYFLEFIYILFYSFDGQIAGGDTVGIDDEELVMKFVHLFLKALMAVHHLEHIVELFAGEDGTIGRFPDMGCQSPDQGTVCEGCFFDGKHICMIYYE